MTASAQQLSTRIACSVERDENGERVIYADSGEIRLDGKRIDAFRWESAQYRSNHGFDCSIDDSDGVQAEVTGAVDGQQASWRLSLADARAAREKRGYDFEHGLNCTIRLARNGDTLHVTPSCPALCGSRNNFTELSVDIKTGNCRYEE
jgi:hypothetical protein